MLFSLNSQTYFDFFTFSRFSSTHQIRTSDTKRATQNSSIFWPITVLSKQSNNKLFESFVFYYWNAMITLYKNSKLKRDTHVIKRKNTNRSTKVIAPVPQQHIVTRFQSSKLLHLFKYLNQRRHEGECNSPSFSFSSQKNTDDLVSCHYDTR